MKIQGKHLMYKYSTCYLFHCANDTMFDVLCVNSNKIDIQITLQEYAKEYLESYIFKICKQILHDK